MNMVNIAEIKNHLSKYIALVEQGKEIVLCRRNVPVARLVPIAAAAENRTRLGCGAGSATVHADLTEPAMDAEDWAMLNGEP